MPYGPDFSDLFRSGANFVDKILRGAKPADIPVEQPTKFDLVINQKTRGAWTDRDANFACGCGRGDRVILFAMQHRAMT